jgi:class 3 adenylate cyclase
MLTRVAVATAGSVVAAALKQLVELAREPCPVGRNLQASAFVTILFTDLVGSTALFDRHGDEAANVLRREHFASLHKAVEEHGGREIKSAGTG